MWGVSLYKGTLRRQNAPDSQDIAYSAPRHNVLAHFRRLSPLSPFMAAVRDPAGFRPARPLKLKFAQRGLSIWAAVFFLGAPVLPRINRQSSSPPFLAPSGDDLPQSRPAGRISVHQNAQNPLKTIGNEGFGAVRPDFRTPKRPETIENHWKMRGLGPK